MSDWQIHPRNADLTRSYDPISGWENLTLVERLNSPDSWTVTGPASALSIFSPGMGCILDRDGQQVTSGRVRSIKRSGTVVGSRAVESMTVAFASDLAALGGRIVRPAPTQALSPAISTFPAAYDLRYGTLEDLIIGYTNAHIGPGALADRRLARLRLPASLGRGGTTQVSGRLDNLGVLIGSLAEAGNLRVTVQHAEDAGGAWLDLTIDATRDLSNDVRFGTADTTAAGLITEWDYDVSEPTSTRPMVALGGELQLREFMELRDPTAEALWTTVVETFVDQRGIAPDSEDKLAEATRAGQEALEAGRGPTRIAYVPMLSPDLEYRSAVRMGDRVGYDLPGLDPAEDKIREATTVAVVEQGQATERVSVVVGTPDAPATRDQQQTARALRAINKIQRS